MTNHHTDSSRSDAWADLRSAGPRRIRLRIRPEPRKGRDRRRGARGPRDGVRPEGVSRAV